MLIYEALEPVDAPGAGSHPGDVGHEPDRGEDVDRAARGVIAAALDEQVDTRTVHAERVAERRAEDVGLRDLAEKRASGTDLGMHEPWVGVEETPKGRRVARADRRLGAL